jgi:uncharacterized protein YjbI with pentapeptide repeats
MRYSAEQLAQLRDRWQQPLVSPESGESVTVDGAATFQELLARAMANIVGLLGSQTNDAVGDGHAAELTRSAARTVWEDAGDAVFSAVLQDLKLYGLPELYPIETPRYQIRDTGDLRGASLKDAVFRGAFLENVHFEGADLTNACFVGARCFETHFEGAQCERATFFGAECHFAVFAGAQCDQVLFDTADCTMVRFDHATLRSASFNETICFAATFDGALLARASISGMRINHQTRFGRPGDIDEAKRSTPSYTRKANEDDDWYIVDLFPAWLRAAQVSAQIRFLLKNHGYFLEADEYQYLEMVCQRHLLHQNRLRHFFEWLFKDLVFGYGLKWKRPLITVLVIILLWGIGFASHFHLHLRHDLLTSFGYGMYYSTISFTTLGFGNTTDLEGFLPKALLCSEALLGTILMPLFLLAYARKILQD